jgi:hypothetical protein
MFEILHTKRLSEQWNAQDDFQRKSLDANRRDTLEQGILQTQIKLHRICLQCTRMSLQH